MPIPTLGRRDGGSGERTRMLPRRFGAANISKLPIRTALAHWLPQSLELKSPVDRDFFADDKAGVIGEKKTRESARLYPRRWSEAAGKFTESMARPLC
jgi:hypothetical protein